MTGIEWRAMLKCLPPFPTILCHFLVLVHTRRHTAGKCSCLPPFATTLGSPPAQTSPITGPCNICNAQQQSMELCIEAKQGNEMRCMPCQVMRYISRNIHCVLKCLTFRCRTAVLSLRYTVSE